MSVKDESAFSGNFGVFDVFDRTLALIKSFVLVVGVGVDLEDFLCMGEGVYAAFKALSVPILMPNLEVANLWAAGLIDDTRIVILLGVLTWDLAAEMALFFLSR